MTHIPQTVIAHMHELYAIQLGGLLVGAMLNPDPKAAAECLKGYGEVLLQQVELYRDILPTLATTGETVR